MPILWTAKTVLVDPGSAVELPIRSTDARYFLPARILGTSIYRPAESVHRMNGPPGGKLPEKKFVRESKPSSNYSMTRDKAQ